MPRPLAPDLLAARALEACTPQRNHLATRHQLALASIGRKLIERCLLEHVLVEPRPGVFSLTPLPARGRHLLKDGVPDPGYVAEVRAVVLEMGAGAAPDRRTAAVLWQMDMLVEPKKIEVRVTRSRTRVKDPRLDVRLSRSASVIDLAVAGFEPIPVTTAVDTVLDCGESRPLREAVVIADSALRRKHVTVEGLVAGVAARAGWPKVKKLRRLLELIDPESGSVLESLLRFLLLTHDLHPQSQVTVLGTDGKTVVGRVDFCFPVARLVIECDGRRWHDPEDARDRDRRRDNGLARKGFLVLRFTWDDVVNSPSYVLAAVRDGLTALAA